MRESGLTLQLTHHASRITAASLLLHKHRRAVAQDFRDARRDLRGVIAHADDRVRAQFARVREHLVERVFASAFAQARVERDVAAENALDARPDVADDRARTDRKSTRLN